MNTSLEWWSKIKNDNVLLIDWLKNQYHGERTAALKIKSLFFTDNIVLNDAEKKAINQIAKEEDIHADWIESLLVSRGITAEILDKESRYWDQVLLDENTKSKEDLSAIAHLAENMRLERIKVIAEDLEAPEDIRNVFKKILPMELKHESIFASMTNKESLSKVTINHNKGLNELGLVI